MKKVLRANRVTVAVCGGLFLLLTIFSVSKAPFFARSDTPAPDTETFAPITLLFVGDIMMDRGVKRSIVNNFAGDYGALFVHTPYVATADIAFMNLEGPVGTKGRNVGSKYSFHMDRAVLQAVRAAGFDIVSFANNHVGDYTREAFDETLELLSSESLLYTGAGKTYAQATRPSIITVRNMRIGYFAATDVGPSWLAATTTQSGVLLANDKNFEQIIASAKAQVDILVVSFHFGEEYAPANARQVLLAHRAVDSGADIVVGHHPHVMERMETYNGKPIFYSLGNFIFDQYFSVHTMRGMVATVSIDPQTKELTTSIAVSPQSRQFIPQAPIPFEESFLITKRFIP